MKPRNHGSFPCTLNDFQDMDLTHCGASVLQILAQICATILKPVSKILDAYAYACESICLKFTTDFLPFSPVAFSQKKLGFSMPPKIEFLTIFCAELVSDLIPQKKSAEFPLRPDFRVVPHDITLHLPFSVVYLRLYR